MRAVLSWTTLDLDMDIHSVQYSKTTRSICHCYYSKKTECTYSKLKVSNDVVRNSFSLCFNAFTFVFALLHKDSVLNCTIIT